MITYHIIYTDRKNNIHSLYKSFLTFNDAEKWCLSLNAIYYEIGIDDKYFNDSFPELSKLGLKAPIKIDSCKPNKD